MIVHALPYWNPSPSTCHPLCLLNIPLHSVHSHLSCGLSLFLWFGCFITYAKINGGTTYHIIMETIGKFNVSSQDLSTICVNITIKMPYTGLNNIPYLVKYVEVWFVSTTTHHPRLLEQICLYAGATYCTTPEPNMMRLFAWVLQFTWHLMSFKFRNGSSLTSISLCAFI